MKRGQTEREQGTMAALSGEASASTVDQVPHATQEPRPAGARIGNFEDGFRGQYAFCSNFYNTPVTYLGQRYRCSEGAYQAAKFSDPEFKARFLALDGKDSKKLGRTKHPSLRADWDQVKVEVMRDILAVKFSRPDMAKALLDTGETELVEINWWKDRFWGVSGGQGENHLGRLLMDIRAELQNAQEMAGGQP